MEERLVSMTHYIALIHKEADSSFGVSFPDVPGVTAAASTIDEAIDEAASVLRFAGEDWQKLTGSPFPGARSIDDLRLDPEFVEAAVNGIVAAIPYRAVVEAAA